ncbi:MAG: FAD:protein FMN transferase [Solirubrobacteraceae bacterium]
MAAELTTTRTTTQAWEWRAMGTTWRIHHDGAVGPALARRVAELVEADEQRWSRFRPDSEVSLLNKCAGTPIEVSDETFEILRACRRWTVQTAGVFQPLVGRLMEQWGYARSLDEGPAGAFASPSPPTFPLGTLRHDDRLRRFIVPPGAALDLGGIAKSWSAVRAAALLRSAPGANRVLIDAGGDIVAAAGDHLVAVELTGERLIVRQGQGVATSGFARRAWRNGDGRPAHHLIDPKTAQPAVRRHATVLADDPVAADVLATCLTVRPELLADRTEACLVLSEDGGRLVSPRWREVLA